MRTFIRLPTFPSIPEALDYTAANDLGTPTLHEAPCGIVGVAELDDLLLETRRIEKRARELVAMAEEAARAR